MHGLHRSDGILSFCVVHKCKVADLLHTLNRRVLAEMPVQRLFGSTEHEIADIEDLDLHKAHNTATQAID